jgi:hypothetical protein
MEKISYLGFTPCSIALAGCTSAHVLQYHLVYLRLALKVYDARENIMCLAKCAEVKVVNINHLQQ